jgi:uncharacterized membrane protein
MKPDDIGTIIKPGIAAPDNAADKSLRIPHFDLILAFFYAVIISALTIVPIPGMVDVVPYIASAMIFFVPGYILLSMVFPRVSPGGWMERIALSAGISAMLSFLLLLSIKYYSGSIGLSYLITCLSALTMLCIMVTFYRRSTSGASSGLSLNLDRTQLLALRAFFRNREGRPERFATVLFAVILLLLIATTAYIVIMPKQGEKFTEFYILGTDGKAENYPVSFSLGEQKPVIVGIANHEYRSVDYNLVISLTDGNSSTQMYSNDYSLSDNQTVENTIMLKPDYAGEKLKMEFDLYADGNMTAPYRQLYLWVNVLN